MNHVLLVSKIIFVDIYNVNKMGKIFKNNEYSYSLIDLHSPGLIKTTSKIKGIMIGTGP